MNFLHLYLVQNLTGFQEVAVLLDEFKGFRSIYFNQNQMMAVCVVIVCADNEHIVATRDNIHDPRIGVKNSLEGSALADFTAPVLRDGQDA